MKKILLIIAIAFCIFQLVVLAADIDIGMAAINRASQKTSFYTSVNRDNPANATGTITTVKIYAKVSLVDCEVATFSASGNFLTTRDSHAIGAVASGAVRTYSGLDIDVEAGDYIGIKFSAGEIEAASSGNGGVWYGEGDLIPCTNEEFEIAAMDDDCLSLYGTGATPPPTFPIAKFNNVEITKWNTKEITKWNTIE